MNLSGNASSVLRAHVTRKCNLPCLQCLAYAGPQRQDEIEPAALRRAIGEAVELGYNLLSISGGEPLLYEGLGEVLEEARRRDLPTEVITNGLLLTESRIAELRPLLGSVTVNVERAPRSTRRLHAVDGYIEILKENLARLRAARAAFTIRFTLTRENAGEIPWVAEFALRQGARMLEVRPLEFTGSLRKLAELVPDGESAALAWLVTDLVRQEHGGELPIRFDIFDCERRGADELTAGGPFPPRPLVIESDGTIVPYRFGFPRPFTLGILGDAPLGELAREWEDRCGDVLRAVTRATFQTLSEPRPYPFVNLFDCLSERATQATEIVLVASRGDAGGRQAACCG